MCHKFVWKNYIILQCIHYWEENFGMCHQLKSTFLFEVYGWICFKIHGSEGIYNVEKLSDHAVLRN